MENLYMQVLNLYGKVKTTMISEKLGLCLSNIPKRFQEHITDAIKIEYLTKKARGIDINLDHICECLISKRKLSLCVSDDDKISLLVQNMICVHSRNFNTSMLKKKNRFCNPVDQIEYGEKFIKFLAHIICYQNVEKNCYLPYVIYDTHFFHDTKLIQILSELKCLSSSLSFNDVNKAISDLQLLGSRIDNYIEDITDFKKIDYIISSVNSYHERDYNAVHFMNTVNLLTLLLVHPKNNGDLGELVIKLPIFMKKLPFTHQEKIEISEFVKKIRNKIAHGAFKQYESLCNQFADKFMKNHKFDYTEFDRETWIISYLCHIVDNCLARVLWLMLEDKKTLKKLQYNKIDISNFSCP